MLYKNTEHLIEKARTIGLTHRDYYIFRTFNKTWMMMIFFFLDFWGGCLKSLSTFFQDFFWYFFIKLLFLLEFALIFHSLFFGIFMSFCSNKGFWRFHIGNNNEKFQIILKVTARWRLYVTTLYREGKIVSTIAILNYFALEMSI